MPKKMELSEKQKKNIDSYSNDIIHIEGTINQIRIRAPMYIGSLNEHGLLTMFREIFQNAIDQLLSEKSPCDYITVLFDEREYKFIISDNGMGLPKELAIDLLTSGHTGKNLKNKELGDYSAGTNGIGAKAVTALSEDMDVLTYHYDGTAQHLHFKKGILKVNEDIPNPDHLQGTTFEFTPDHSVLGDTPLNPGVVYTLVRDILSLIPIGSRISYTSINKRGKAYHEDMVNEEGIITNILGKSSSMLVTPITIFHDNGRMKLEAAFTFDQQDLGGEDITAYANMCPTSTVPLNSHVTGTVEGITSWFSNYMNKTYLTEKERNKIKVNASDVKMGLKLMISAWTLEPIFTGQAKEILSNQEFRPFAKQVVQEALDIWAKTKSGDLLKICKFLKDISLMRLRSENEKVKVTAKYATSASTGLPAKFCKPSDKNAKDLELFIVEGESASGSARSARNVRNQGIFPIKGKILNVFQASPQKIAANAEIMGIVQILGAGYGKNFDIKKCKWSKIIFMGDADADGSHISDLLLLMCLKLFPGLVESGRVYKAVPPLYGIPLSKNKMKYFADRVDFIRSMQKEYYKKNTVLDISKKPIDAVTFSRILIENADYLYDCATITERYKVNPKLLEIVITSHLRQDSITKLKKRITSEFRFMESDNIVKIGDTIRIKGLINGRVETLFYNDRFIQDCEPIIEPIRKAMSENHMEFIVNGNKVGLFEMVQSAMDTASSVSRFKGLGEMDANQLAESTMDSNSRTLIQYTVNDIDESVRIIRQYDSNKKLIFNHIADVSRDDLIGV